MVVWRNIHEKKIAWSSRHVWWFKVVGAVSTIVSAYENHMSHRFSSTNQLWQSLGWSVFISQRLGFPCLFSNRLHFGIHFTFLGIMQLMKVPYNVQPPRAKLAQKNTSSGDASQTTPSSALRKRPGDGRVEANCNGFPAAKKKSFNSWEGIRYHYWIIGIRAS